MLEALRCSPPDMNNGEDNAMYKTLMGTLLACPGQSRCNDPLLYRPAFFPPTDPTTFNCRQQWKARRAEIELLAVRAEEKSNAAKRIPVLADTVPYPQSWRRECSSAGALVLPLSVVDPAMRPCFALFRTPHPRLFKRVPLPRAPINPGRVLCLPPTERHPAP